jgi:hypothetical protein
MFQKHSLGVITRLAKGVPDDALKIGFTPELVVPLIAERLKTKTDELEQLGNIQSDKSQSAHKDIKPQYLMAHEDWPQK